MKRELYIHIGLNKAASTTIQAGLFLNREELMKNKVLIPKTGKPKHKGAGHQNIAWGILNHKRYQKNLGDIDDLCCELQNLQFQKSIITSEYFMHFNQDQKKLLKRSFSEFDVYIIIYLRRQDKWLQSLWSEITKMGLCGATFQEYIHPNNINKIFQSFYATDYYDLAYNWGNVFGHENIKIRVLEGKQIVINPFIDILFTCGLENYSRYKIPENLNVSPGLKTLEIIRGLAVALSTAKVSTNHIRKVASWVREYGSNSGWDEDPLNVVDESTYERIMKNFFESNIKLAKEYKNQNILFFEGYNHEPINEFEINDLNSKELFDLIGFIIDKSNKINL